MKPLSTLIASMQVLAMATSTPPIACGEHRSRQVRTCDLRGTLRGESRETTAIKALPYMYVDAVVVDSEGRPVRGLTHDDFTLREDGVDQEIVAFEAIESATAGDGRSNQDVMTSLGRRMIVVFDEAHLSPASARAARIAVARLVESELRDGDEISLVPTDRGAWWDARMPMGREDALAVIRRLQGRPQLAALQRLSVQEAARILAEGELIGANRRRDGSIVAHTPLLEMQITVTKPDIHLTIRERVKRRFLTAGLCELDCDDQINAIAEPMSPPD
jgi:hypothetical protein